jgi:hypothetical protein
MALFQLPYERFFGDIVDRELVDRIAALGIDVRTLPQALLCREYNGAAAIYMIWKRDQMSEALNLMMSDLMKGAGAMIQPRLSTSDVVVNAPAMTAKQVLPRRLESTARPVPAGIGAEPANAQRTLRPVVLQPRRRSSTNTKAPLLEHRFVFGKRMK